MKLNFIYLFYVIKNISNMSGVMVCLCIRISFPLSCVCVWLLKKKKIIMGNCPTLLKRLCYV